MRQVSLEGRTRERDRESKLVMRTLKSSYRLSLRYCLSLLQQELMLRQSTTDAPIDPFLSSINEQHARQESADSGLGLGSAYSLPHTPEDFLANIDDNMDGTSGKKPGRHEASLSADRFIFHICEFCNNPISPRLPYKFDTLERRAIQ